ncbi:hypothetical protein [Lacticaseibacillus sharpeae]|uniref:hypothetical protein n=1 Tax=Lacticaseibacillus sharpeae TaxID=1626 RepID=UPI0006D2B995|nr:hypothetical protein [Lacticaseibacillus sharpeae]
MAKDTFETQVESYRERIATMQRENYRAFVFALVACEDGSISEEDYDCWYNSDFPLLDEGLLNPEEN